MLEQLTCCAMANMPLLHNAAKRHQTKIFVSVPLQQLAC